MAELQFCKHLAPGGKARKLVRHLVGVGGDAVALIGHEPDLSEFAARVMGSNKAQIELAKAGVAMLRCDGVPDKGRGTLVWLITPEWANASSEEAPTSVAGW